MAGKKGKKKQRDLDVDDAYSYVKEKKKKENTKEEEEKKKRRWKIIPNCQRRSLRFEESRKCGKSQEINNGGW
jgi:hypothetical protein